MGDWSDGGDSTADRVAVHALEGDGDARRGERKIKGSIRGMKSSKVLGEVPKRAARRFLRKSEVALDSAGSKEAGQGLT